ncbi:MAG: hypothetical protein K6G56_05385 [Clostridiales bacterium]|nr:hypothetical protein [Clostridiales bacterium]
MQTLFLKIVNMSLSGAIVILAVLLARLMLKKAPKKWPYLLWLAAAFRLVCPVSIRSVISLFGLVPAKVEAASGTGAAARLCYIPEDIASRASVTNPPAGTFAPVGTLPPLATQVPSAVTTALPTNITTAVPTAVPTAVTTAVPNITAAPAASAVPSVTTAPLPSLAPVATAAPAVTGNTSAVNILLTVGAALWCVGMAALLIYAVVTLIKLRRRLAPAVRLEGDVFIADGIPTPFILGVFRPRIYLPRGLNGDILGCVLAHERCHIKRGDHIVKLLAYAILTVHWFNPLCWLAFFLMSRDMEMSCDERVLSKEENMKKPYSMALLSLATEKSAGGEFPRPCPIAFGETGVKSRIKNALRFRKPKLWISILSAAICLAVLAACSVNPEKPAETEAPVKTEEAAEPTETPEPGSEETPEPTAVAVVPTFPAGELPEYYGDCVKDAEEVLFLEAEYDVDWYDTVYANEAAVGYGEWDGFYQCPPAFAVEGDNIYVIDTVKQRIIAVKDGKTEYYTAASGAYPHAWYQDGHPWHICVWEGNIYLANKDKPEIYVLDENGRHIKTIPLPKGLSAGHISHLGVDENGPLLFYWGSTCYRLNVGTDEWETVYNIVVSLTGTPTRHAVYKIGGETTWIELGIEDASVSFIDKKNGALFINADEHLSPSAYLSGEVSVRKYDASGRLLGCTVISQPDLYGPAETCTYVTADGTLYMMVSQKDGVHITKPNLRPAYVSHMAELKEHSDSYFRETYANFDDPDFERWFREKQGYPESYRITMYDTVYCEELDLRGTGFASYKDLDWFWGLKRLRYDGPVQYAATLHRLEYLELEADDERLITALKNMRFLRELSITSSAAEVIDLPAENCIEKLTLKCPKLMNIDDLYRLDRVTELSLDCDSVVYFGPISNMKELRKLHLKSGEAWGTDFLAGFNKLEELELSFGETTDISSIAGLSSLRRLKLECPKLRDLSPLEGLKGLEYLDLSGTPASREQLDALRAALPGCLIVCSSDPTASLGGKVYTCTYLWGENADEEYTWTIILHEPESPVSETNGATGFVFEGVTYEMQCPGPYFEAACGDLPPVGRLWRNETEPYRFFGGEEGPEDSSGPCLLWRENGSFSFTVSPAVSYTLTFSPKE